MQTMLLFLAVSLLVCCILPFGYFLYDYYGNKSFYQESSRWDYLRFPLLEPYYAININDEYGWSIPVMKVDVSDRNFLSLVDILNVEKIAVVDGVILAYSSYSKTILLTGKSRVEKELHWFILIPGQAELGFETEGDFLMHVRQQGIERIRWQEPDVILEQFDQTRCLEWITGCK